MADTDIKVTVGKTDDNDVFAEMQKDAQKAMEQMRADAKASADAINSSLQQIVENTKNVPPSVKETKTAFQQLRDEIGGNFINALKGAAIGFIGLQGAMKIFQELKKGREELKEQSLAYGSLTITLGHYSQILSLQAAQLEANLLISRKDTVTAQERLAVYVKDDMWIAKLIPAELNLSRAMGVDLGTAAQIIGRNISSDTGELGRYHIAITGAADSTERMQSIFDQINKHIGDQTKAIKEDIQGWDLLGKAWKEGWQDISAAIAGESKTSALERTKTRIVESLEDEKKRIEDLKETLEKYKDAGAGKSILQGVEESIKAEEGYITFWQNKLDMIGVEERAHAERLRVDALKTANIITSAAIDMSQKSGEDIHGYKQTEEQKKAGEAGLKLQKEQQEEMKRQKELQIRDNAELQESQAKSIKDEGTRKLAILGIQQKEEIDLRKLNGEQTATLIKKQQQEMVNLKTDIADEAAKKELEKSKKEGEELAKEMQRHLKMVEDANKKMQEEAEKHREKMIEITMQMSEGVGKALGSMFSGKKNAAKDGLRELLGVLVDFGEKELMVYLGIDTAKNIATLGPAGLAKAAIEGALIEAAGTMIKGAISGFALGTSYAPGGMALVGEQGPEYVNLPRGSQVYNNTQTRNIANNSLHTFNIHVHDAAGNLLESATTAIRSGNGERFMSTINDHLAGLN